PHRLIFDIHPDTDVYWCAADVGWVTGHSYIVYGPLANGCTSVMYEGVPNYPDKDRFWDIVERYKVSILYTAPTTIRTMIRWGPEYPEKHDLSSLRLLGTVGEPINPEAWIWYHTVIGRERCPIVDTWWQTETGMIMITPLPGLTTTRPGSATFPFPGVGADVVDDQGASVPLGGGGYLTLTRPWQAIAAFVSLKGEAQGDEALIATLRDHVATKIGKIARPASIVFTPELPKTRSGKIMRRLLKDVSESRQLGDVTTLANAAVIDDIAQRAAGASKED